MADPPERAVHPARDGRSLYILSYFSIHAVESPGSNHAGFLEAGLPPIILPRGSSPSSAHPDRLEAAAPDVPAPSADSSPGVLDLILQSTDDRWLQRAAAWGMHEARSENRGPSPVSRGR